MLLPHLKMEPYVFLMVSMWTRPLWEQEKPPWESLCSNITYCHAGKTHTRTHTELYDVFFWVKLTKLCHMFSSVGSLVKAQWKWFISAWIKTNCSPKRIDCVWACWSRCHMKTRENICGSFDRKLKLTKPLIERSEFKWNCKASKLELLDMLRLSHKTGSSSV